MKRIFYYLFSIAFFLSCAPDATTGSSIIYETNTNDFDSYQSFVRKSVDLLNHDSIESSLKATYSSLNEDGFNFWIKCDTFMTDKEDRVVVSVFLDHDSDVNEDALIAVKLYTQTIQIELTRLGLVAL